MMRISIINKQQQQPYTIILLCSIFIILFSFANCSRDESLVSSSSEDKVVHPSHLMALSFSLIAGISTFIGGFIIICMGKPSDGKIGYMMGFASGVMMFVSFFHLIPESIEDIGVIPSIISFIIGSVLFIGISKVLLGDSDQEDFILKHHEDDNLNQSSSTLSLEARKDLKQNDDNSRSSGGNSSSDESDSDSLKKKEVVDVKKPANVTTNRKRLYHTAIIVTLGLSLHNLPEGMAVYTSTLTTYKLGLMIALAIGLHNVPEGMAVAIAVYAATNSIYQSLKYSLISGLCEPLGAALFGAMIYLGFLPHYIVFYMLAGCGGIMVIICFTELIPTSLEYLENGHSHMSSVLHCIFANALGMLVIYLCSLFIEQYEH